MRRRINYANVTATLALFFAMSGGALAAKHYLINSTKQINPKVLKALKGKEGPSGKEGKAGPEGKAGKEGPSGKEGEAGAPGTALAYARVNANGTLVSSQSKGVVSVTNPTSGLYCFQLSVTAHVATAAAEHIGGQFDTSTETSVRPDVATHTGTCTEPNRDASVVITGGGVYGGGAGPSLENDDFMVLFN